MELSKVKEYLQNYLDSVAIPRFNEEPNDDGIENFEVYDVLKGSYQPPIIHVFLHSVPNPNVRYLSDTTKVKLRQLEKDIEGFMRMLSIKFPIRTHLNKSPLFKSGKTYSKEI